jgi:hypothetical protein
MARHMLEPVGKGSVEDVVGRLGAIRSESDLTVGLSVGMRRAGAKPGDVATAIGDGRLIKAFTFRGAVHLMTPQTAAMYLRIRTASRQWGLRSWVTYYKLSAADWPAFRAFVRDALTDRPLTPSELGAALKKSSRYRHLAGFFPEQSWTLIKALMWQGDMCFSPSADGKARFQRLDANPRWPGLPELDDAGPRAIEAYLAAYGPATPAHLHYWLGEGLAAGRKRVQDWFKSQADRMAEVSVDGKPAYVLRGDLDDLLAARASDAVRLLPVYDQWVMGPGTADPHVTPASRRGLVTRGSNIAIIGGVVAGVWTLKGDVLKVEWFDKKKAPAEAVVAAEVERVGRILGRTIRVSE